MDILSNFSKTFKDLLEENELNAEKFGKTIGFDPTVVRRWCLPNKDIY